MKFARTIAAVALALLLGPAATHAKIRVAASINDLASIASSVGGDQVEAFAVARPNADAHRVEVLPSYMVKVARADLYLKVGLGLDQWADAIIAGSRNRRIAVVDCSRGVDVLERPTGKVTAAMGDVHPNGNPHYWLDPRNGARVARTIADALAARDPAHTDQYRARAEAFAREAEASYRAGVEAAAKLPSKAVFTYHRSWPYFAEAFGLEVLATIEPVPGIPPTAKHLAELVRIAKSRQVRTLIQEPYFSSEAGKFLERQARVRPAIASPSCESPRAGSYLSHIREVLAIVTSATRAGTDTP